MFSLYTHKHTAQTHKPLQQKEDQYSRGKDYRTVSLNKE